MIRQLAKRIGASYIWGVINFAIGVALGSAEGSLITQALFNHVHH